MYLDEEDALDTVTKEDLDRDLDEQDVAYDDWVQEMMDGCIEAIRR